MGRRARQKASGTPITIEMRVASTPTIRVL
jgi:hypothetical protein